MHAAATTCHPLDVAWVDQTSVAKAVLDGELTLEAYKLRFQYRDGVHRESNDRTFERIDETKRSNNKTDRIDMIP